MPSASAQRFPRVCRCSRRRAFTLIELLVAIGIILILIGILFPVVKKIRLIAYSTNTKNEISQIASACQRYYETFNDYPGPLSNSQLEGYVGYSIVDSSSSPNNLKTATATVTSSENLVLGLCGGLVNLGGQFTYINNAGSTIYPSGSAQKVSTLIGTGPFDLSTMQTSAGMTSPDKQYPSFINVTYPQAGGLLSYGYYNGSGHDILGNSVSATAGYVDETGRAVSDSEIPVFVDRYPEPLPILYVRARKGAPGIVSDLSNFIPGTAQKAYYNYNIAELLPYTGPASSSSVILQNGNGVPSGIGLPPQGGGIYAANTSNIPNEGQHGLQGIGTLAYSGTSPTPVPFNTTNNAGQYFMNPSIPPTNYSSTPTSDYINSTGTPRQKDTFILIAAGPDRTYGTADDETNFGDVNP